ncbi:MAG: hypothetical protein U0229_17915 [Anaeromyxobacter sp.]
MPLSDVLSNPLLRRALAAGEEGVGKVVGKLLASPTVTTGVSTLVTGALQARRTVEGGLQKAIQAARLPSQEDVEALRQRLDELESMIDGMSEQVRRAPAPRAGEDDPIDR